MADRTTVGPESDGPPYVRRWIGHASASTKAFWGLHVAGFILSVLGTSVGLIALSALTGSATLGEVFVEWRWLVFGTVGVLAVLAVTWLVQFFRAPAALDRALRREWAKDMADAAAEALRRQDELNAALHESQAAVERLESERLASEIRVEVVHDGPPLKAIDTTAAVRDRFIEYERDRYRLAFERWKGEDQRRRARSVVPLMDTRVPAVTRT